MKQLRLLSGIPSSESGGTARFLSHLEEDADSLRGDISVQFEYRPNPFKQRGRKFLGRMDQLVPLASSVPASLIQEGELLIFHPQALGYRFTTNLLRKRDHTWHFILDSSFFCRRSYNHLDGDNNACLQCVESGRKMADENSCGVFPWIQGGADGYLDCVAKAGDSISYLVQSQSSADLVRRVVGETARIEVVGMAADFDLTRDRSADNRINPDRIVFHGNPLEAKGFHWSLELAREMPGREFLFPFAKPSNLRVDMPSNCRFQAMTWETGLRQEIETSGGVLCPSLWSAPIEGAFIKSLLHGFAVGYVHVDSSTSSEYQGDELAEGLSSDPATAAEEFDRLLQAPWSPAVWSKRKQALSELVGLDRKDSQLQRIIDVVFG